MQRRTVMTGLAASLLGACETLDPAILDGVLGGYGGGLTQADAALGIRAALDLSLIHIPSPRDRTRSRMPSSA